jgi:hypothetical protein
MALVLSSLALVLVVFRNPLGHGMSKYDFSSPIAAMNSEIEMQLNHDFLAALERDEVIEGTYLREKLKTLEVRKEREWKGSVILFVAYKRNGVEKHEVKGFEKHAKTGLWMHKYVSPYEVKDDNQALRKEISEWEGESSRFKIPD